LVLAPLHTKYKIKRVVVSTYQSVTGTGAKAVRQLENERNGIKGEMAYPYPIDLNLFPHGGDFLANGYTSEEMKLVNETHKILGDNSIGITATIVRVPVLGGHSEAVNIEFYHDFMLGDLVDLLTLKTLSIPCPWMQPAEMRYLLAGSGVTNHSQNH